ncbi:MAG: carbohydrate kinase family protein [Halolamina sp.]|uniref:carbohydrate kinase family protein n=1 Tax=Halolamina sp. TaxID=1940283 RepID=UPI002FC3D045
MSPEPDSTHADTTAGSDGHELVAVGAATVDRTYEVTNLPEPDGGAFAHSVSDSFGGVGANVATGAARLGRAAGLLARLGEDGFGDRVEADLDAGPLDTSLVRRRPGTTTHCIIPRGPAGDRMIITAGDSTTRLRLDEDDRTALRAADAVFATAYVPDPVTTELIALAEEPDGPAFVFDLSGPVAELKDRGTERETIDRAVRAADLFVVGELAAESYLDRPATMAVDALRERGCRRGAVTFGEAGSTVFDGEETTAIDAFDVDVVDTTGAGDAFVAALIDRWLLGEADPAMAGEFAAAAAALNCSAQGARGGLADRETVRAFLSEHGR